MTRWLFFIPFVLSLSKDRPSPERRKKVQSFDELRTNGVGVGVLS